MIYWYESSSQPTVCDFIESMNIIIMTYYVITHNSETDVPSFSEINAGLYGMSSSGSLCIILLLINLIHIAHNRMDIR